jgi:hypothetical protein
MNQFPDSELALYIGDYDDKAEKPLKRDDGNVVAGAYDEDEAYYNPFNEFMSYNRHFWDPERAYHVGIGGFDSGLNRAHKYFSGGYGVNGKYDPAWSPAEGKRKGVKDQGAAYLYAHGEKPKAYWYLGHMVHLLEDLTIPAHTHLWAHVVAWMDGYETYMTKAHRRWPVDASGPIETFPSLLAMYRDTALKAHSFDCGNGSGMTGGIDGTSDRGRRRKNGFTKSELDEEGSVLMPLAFSRVASLYRYFYSQVDKTAPTVILTSPEGKSADNASSTDNGLVTLSATAHDDAAGTDKDGFSFLVSFFDGSDWSAWKPVSAGTNSGKDAFFAGKAGLYKFKATAVDAAGNIGESEEKFLRIESARPEYRRFLEARRPARRAAGSAAAR